MNATKPTSDFVIGMTLAEVFLLLLFLIWWAVAAERADATAGPDGSLSAAVLREQVAELKIENRRLNNRIEDLLLQLEVKRIMYGDPAPLPPPGPTAGDG